MFPRDKHMSIGRLPGNASADYTYSESLPDLLQWLFQCLLEGLNAAHRIHYKHWQNDSTKIEVYNRSASIMHLHCLKLYVS